MMSGLRRQDRAAGTRTRWQTARAMDLAENRTTVRVRIVPDHVTLRCHPFEPVVHASILTAVRPFRIVKRAGMRLPEPGQDLVKPLRRTRSGTMPPRQCRHR